jgi:hypothetical protein
MTTWPNNSADQPVVTQISMRVDHTRAGLKARSLKRLWKNAFAVSFRAQRGISLRAKSKKGKIPHSQELVRNDNVVFFPHYAEPVPPEFRQVRAFRRIFRNKKKSSIKVNSNKIPPHVFLRDLCALRVLCVKIYGVPS